MNLETWFEDVPKEPQYELLQPIVRNGLHDGFLYVSDDKYRFDSLKFSQALESNLVDVQRSYKFNVNASFRGPGGSVVGFPNLRGRSAEFDDAHWRFHPDHLQMKTKGRRSASSPDEADLRSAHLGGNRSPVGGPSRVEWAERLEYIFKLINDRDVGTAVQAVCWFEHDRQHRSRVVAKNSKKSKKSSDGSNPQQGEKDSPQANVLDSLTKQVVESSPTKMTRVYKNNRFIQRREPTNALTLVVCAYASGMVESFTLYENTMGGPGKRVSLLEFLKKTDVEDRTVFKEMTGFEFPFLTDDHVRLIIETARDFISPEILNLIKEAVGYDEI